MKYWGQRVWTREAGCGPGHGGTLVAPWGSLGAFQHIWAQKFVHRELGWKVCMRTWKQARDYSGWPMMHWQRLPCETSERLSNVFATIIVWKAHQLGTAIQKSHWSGDCDSCLSNSVFSTSCNGFLGNVAQYLDHNSQCTQPMYIAKGCRSSDK